MKEQFQSLMGNNAVMAWRHILGCDSRIGKMGKRSGNGGAVNIVLPSFSYFSYFSLWSEEKVASPQHAAVGC